eukprot:4117623-Pleurochrysis_carterae.AAC.1
MRWPLEKRASLVNADAGPVTREPLISTETLASQMAVLSSPRAAKASANTAREGVVPQDSPRPRIGKG